MKKLFIVFLLLNLSFLFGQGRSPLIANYYLVPEDSSFNFYYLYKIPYNKLIFEKQNDFYSAEFKISIEINDADNNFITRQIKNEKIKVKSFEETSSDKLFLENIIELKLGEGKYVANIFIGDNNSDREVELKPLLFSTESLSERGYLKPILIQDEFVKCNNDSVYRVHIFNEGLPFSNEKIDLIIPFTDNSINHIFVQLTNNNEKILEKKIDAAFLSNFELKTCNENIVLNGDSSTTKFKFFKIPFINKNIFPGKAHLKISTTDDFKNTKSITYKVNWINKPFSLTKPEMAVKYLMLMTDEETYEKSKSGNSENYLEPLFSFWKEYDPDPETSFNPLMQEYYERVDFAVKNFSSIKKSNGAQTDRGKTFILFGKPKNIERHSSNNGYIVETWIYNNPDRKFVFVDKTGTGNFILKGG